MKNWITCFLFLAVLVQADAQKVYYSEPDKNDARNTNFEIIGKLENNILIYKSLRDQHSITIYDMEMKEKDRVKMEFLPSRIINADFLAYPDFCYMFYQFQKRNVVYSMAAKLNTEGSIVGEPVVLDTTSVNFWASNKLYNVIFSEDKQQILVFKISNKNEKNHVVTTSLFNKELQLQERTTIGVTMPERNDYLTEFGVDNEGNIVFARAIRSQQSDYINNLFLLIKNKGADRLIEHQLDLKKIFLDDIKIKVDNYNKKYLVTSFYSKVRNGSVDGIYTAIWDVLTDAPKAVAAIPFNESLRNDAKGENSMRAAFNNFFINNIIVRKDGGFLVTSESLYSTGRAAGFNRNDYLYGSPFMRASDYYTFSPYSASYPWWRWNSFNQVTRYHAQNVAVFSFDSSANLSWANVVNKSQYDDETDAFIGYQMVNTGDQLHFLFNQQERRLQLLASQSITPSGEINRSPTLRNMDKGYDFMPRYGKQVGSRQIIFPCLYRNYLCFARLDL